MNTIPKFLVRYFVRGNINKTGNVLRNPPPIVKYSVFSTEDELTEGVRVIVGNYTIFEIGKESTLNKSYFDSIFLAEKEEVERQKYLLLKQRYEQNGETT